MDPIKSGKFWFCFAHYRFVAGGDSVSWSDILPKTSHLRVSIMCNLFWRVERWNALYVYTPKDEWSNWFCFTLEVAPKLPFVREWSSTPIVGVSIETDSLFRVTISNVRSSYNHLMGIHSRKGLPMVVELLRPVWCCFFQKWCWEWNAITDHNVRGVPGVFMTYNWLFFERCLHNPWTIQLVYHHACARVKAKMLPSFIPRCSSCMACLPTFGWFWV